MKPEARTGTSVKTLSFFETNHAVERIDVNIYNNIQLLQRKASPITVHLQ